MIFIPVVIADLPTIGIPRFPVEIFDVKVLGEWKAMPSPMRHRRMCSERLKAGDIHAECKLPITDLRWAPRIIFFRDDSMAAYQLLTVDLAIAGTE